VTLLKIGPDDAEFGERAAILEYDGGYSRAEAERLACVEVFLRAAPISPKTRES
jgi:hypothetical protein